MAKDTTGDTGTDTADGTTEGTPSMALRGHFVKTLNFKGPGLQKRPKGQSKANFKVHVDTSEFGAGVHELMVTIAADVGSETEKVLTFTLEYGAQYHLTNVPESDQEAALIIEGGRQVFPYIQKIIADVSRDGGLPPLLIPELDFVNIYKMRTSAAEGQP